MDRTDKAISIRSEKYNCCQCVLAALEDLTGMDRETALRLGAAFGGGMGCMESTCGALLGAAIAYSSVAGSMTVGNPLNKFEVQKHSAAMLKEFQDTAGAVRCSP